MDAILMWEASVKFSDDGYPKGQWIAFDPHIYSLLPRFAGVYVIFFDGEPVYVGQSCNIRARLSCHRIRHGYGTEYHTPWGDIPHSIKITAKFKLSRRYGDWAMMELRLIKKLRPRFNGTFVNPDRHAA